VALTVEHWQETANPSNLVDVWQYENTVPGTRDELPADLGEWLYDGTSLYFVVQSALNYGNNADLLIRRDTGRDEYLQEEDVVVEEGDYVGKRLSDGVVFVPNPALYDPV
jgi:hypothetical protein